MRVLAALGDDDTLVSGPLLPDGSFTSSGQSREEATQAIIWPAIMASSATSSATLTQLLSKYSTAIYIVAGALLLLAVAKRPGP